MAVTKLITHGLLLALVSAQSGCATYYSHYGSFAAENASGELREHVLSWQTADYPDWWLLSDRSTPMTLETQCSDRKIRFFDRTQGDGTEACGSNDASILWCGDPSQDLTQQGLPVKTASHVCGFVTSEAGDNVSIAELGSTLQLNMQCSPARPVVGSGDDAKNFDYLKMSSVPYLVSVKKVEKGSWDDRPMKLDTKVCKAEE